MKKNWFTHNIGLKVLAFFLAAGTWFYVVNELNKTSIDERATLLRIFPYKVAAKKIPIRLNIVGNPVLGYEIETGNIVMNPDTCIIIGPKDVLETIKEVTTEPINISEYTRTFTKNLTLLPIGKDIVLEGQFTQVTIPIHQVTPKKEEPALAPTQ